jgi:rod shape-determining protein MreC
MDSFFVRYKNSLVLIAVLLAQTIGLALQVPHRAESTGTDGRSVLLIRYWTVSAITPFERLFHGIGWGIRYGWSNYIDLRHIRSQNLELQKQLGQLRIQQTAIAEDAIQAHRLQALLAFQQHYVVSTVAAQVIGTSGSELSRVVYIDKGKADGLKSDQAVITPDGIVGKIRDVFPHTAQVLLVNDQTSGAGVMLSSTRIRGILKGTAGGKIVINNLTADSRIKPGETVLTSGGDQVYPRGLPVGTIESIATDPDHQPYTLIQLRPAANLFQLEEVLIITGTQTELSPQLQHDLATGAATAAAESQAAAARAAEQKAIEDAKSAAEIVADRLPSLHDDAAPVDPNAKPDSTAEPGGKVPRPLPTLRPDHYSSGSTPPAADLTPGASHVNEPVARPTEPAKQPTQPSTNPQP